MDWAVIGVIAGPHGIRGEFRVYPLMDSPEQLMAYATVYAERNGEQRELSLEKRRVHKGMLLCKAAGIDTIEQAQELRGSQIVIPRAQLPALPEGRYYQTDLLGMAVESEEEGHLGKIEEILDAGPRSVFSVRTPEGTELLLPNIPEVVLSVSLENQRMLVRLLPGMGT